MALKDKQDNANITLGKGIIGGFSVLTAGSILGAIISAATTITLSRVLLPSSLGDATIVFSIAVWFQLLADLGISTAIVKRVGSASSVKEQSSLLGSYVLWKTILGSIMVLFSTCIVLLVRFSWAAIMGGDIILLVWIVVLGNSLSTMTNGFFFSLQNFKGVTLNELSKKVVVLLFILLVGPHLQAYAYVLGTGLSGILSMLISFAYFGRERKQNPRISFSDFKTHLRHLNRMIRFGLPLSVSNLFKYVYMSLPIFLLAIFTSSNAIGIYSLALTLSEISLLITVNMANTLLPVLSSFELPSQKGEFISVVETANRVVLLISIPVSIFMAVSGPQLMTFVFSVSYFDSSEVLWGFAILAASHPLLHNLNVTISSVGQTKLNMTKSFLIMSLIVVFSVILIPRYGALGASLSISLGVLMGVLISGSYVNARLGIYALSSSALLAVIASGIVSSLALHFLLDFVHSLPMLILSYIACGVLFIFLSGAFGAIRKRDLKLVEGVLSNNYYFNSYLRPVLRFYSRVAVRKQ
jgi:O-antigen/teichoic acid export membrane protein